MDKSSFSWIAVILAILGAAVTAGYPAWGTITGIVILILSGAIAAGAIAQRSNGYTVERRFVGQKIPHSLVTLSSAAIFAVYAAGYHHTGSAADEFEGQAARRKTAAPIPAKVVTPKLTTLGVDPTPTIALRSPTPKVKTVPPKPSSVAAPNPTTVPAPTEASPVLPSAPSVMIPTNDPVAGSSAPPPTVTSQLRYKDGTYLGWGSCRHGDIQASVVIQGGQIVSTAVAQCLTRYSCSWIADLPGQVISRQNSNVDYVSGATQSSDAFSDAVAAALSKASE